MKLGKKNFNSGQRKILFVSGNAGDEKNLHLGGHNFFNGFPGDNSLGSLAFFAFLVFFLLVCFLKLKAYILILIRLYGLVSDKFFFTRNRSGNKATFFGLCIKNMDFFTLKPVTGETVYLFIFISLFVSFADAMINQNSKHRICTKIKSSCKEYVTWTCFKFWPMKTIFRKLSAGMVFYKITENNSR